MTMRKGREPAPGIEALNWLAHFDIPTPGANTTLQDFERRQAAIDKLQVGMNESLANDARLHGWRVQNLFEAVIVSLGSVQLIKAEDTGSYYYDDCRGRIRPPDFRLVRHDGEQLLVEVKSVFQRGAFKPGIAVRAADLEEEIRYANLADARLLVAHYWSRLNLWTIVDARVLKRQGNKFALDFETAMMANEFGFLGDATIATLPPLVFSLTADPNAPQLTKPIDDTTREVEFTIGGVELYNEGRLIEDEIEWRVAWFLLLHGPWEMETKVKESDGRIQRISYIFTPPESGGDLSDPVRRRRLAAVGTLSSMYSSFYNSITLTEGGKVSRLRHEPEPAALGNLVPPGFWDKTNRSLALWRFEQRPSVGPASGQNDRV